MDICSGKEISGKERQNRTIDTVKLALIVYLLRAYSIISKYIAHSLFKLFTLSRILHPVIDYPVCIFDPLTGKCPVYLILHPSREYPSIPFSCSSFGGKYLGKHTLL